MIMVIDHQREAEPLREVLNLLLRELNDLCHRHQPESTTTHQDGGEEIHGAAAFRFSQFMDLAEWLERQLEESPLNLKAIRQRQMELSSFLVWCDRRDLLPPLLSTLGASEGKGSRQGTPAIPILSTIEQCLWGAADVLRLSSSQPHVLHYLLLRARDLNAAREAWNHLKKSEGYLTSDILVQIILNSGFGEVIQDAWKLLQSRDDLTRRNLELLVSSASLPQIREQARVLIEE
jgi:hypothetical protein